jgi:hypothetical protein
VCGLSINQVNTVIRLAGTGPMEMKSKNRSCWMIIPFNRNTRDKEDIWIGFGLSINQVNTVIWLGGSRPMEMKWKNRDYSMVILFNRNK